jgi:serine/threonine protein phosphatase PrpC
MRLNENHALGAQIDYLVSRGIMRREEAQSYPDQSCLTSVLIGAEIAQIDCRATPFQIRDGDILIVASDGVQYLSEIQIEAVLRFNQKRSADDIGAAMMCALRQLDDPTQDNIALCVIKAQRKGAEVGAPLTEAPVITSEERFQSGSVTIFARVTRGKRSAKARG